MAYQMQQVNWTTESEKLRALREKVFVCEYHIPKNIEFDQLDRVSEHIILLNEQQQIIAGARLSDDGLISRVAVLIQYRTEAVYLSLFNFLVAVAKQKGITELSFNCVLYEKDKFLKVGFKPKSHVFMEAGIARQRLFCPIDEFIATEFSLIH